jgi:MoxR-like ATPase
MVLKELQKVFLKKSDIFTDILGQDQLKKELKSALAMGRNVIIQGPPGVGKTTLAKNVASLLGKDAPFIRIQGSPDLTAEDLFGDIDPIKALKFGPLSKEAFTPGKIFKADKGVLFFDELNRCPEKLQNALLQVLQERIVTIGSYSVDFTADFIFIGTMNPEDASTEKLSNVFLDRMDVLYMTYPETLDIEEHIVTEQGERLDVRFPKNLLTFSVGFVRELRSNPQLLHVPSVRASLGLYERGQSMAILEGRKEVTMADIKAIMHSVIAHRIKLKPSVQYLKKPKEFVKEAFNSFTNAKGFHNQGDDHEESSDDGDVP